MSRTLVLSLSLGLLALAARPARADDTGVWKALKGRIIVSDGELGAGYDSDGAMIAGLKKANRTVLTGVDGSWTLNMMIFLKEPAGANEINIVYYPAGNAKKGEEVNYTQIAVQPTQKTVQLNGQTVSKEMSFEVGKKYEIRATRMVGGKEVVYAKTVVQLK